eukprot:Opistho-2@12899
MVFQKNIRISVKTTNPKTRFVLLESKLTGKALLIESDNVHLLAPDELSHLKSDGKFAKLPDVYGIWGILRVGEEVYVPTINECTSVGKINTFEILCARQTEFVPVRTSVNVYGTRVGRGEEEEHLKLYSLRKLVNSGSFYFADGYDLSLSAQRQGEQSDTRFMWNRYLQTDFVRHNVEPTPWVLPVMRGSIELRTVYAGHKQAKAALISRLSCERAGRRFITRGVDDDGNVANFVETEQALSVDDIVASFVQSRGSVPVFWEQPGVQVGQHKVKLARGFDATVPAFRRHIDHQTKVYGPMMIVNLLGHKEGEKMLSDEFESHVRLVKTEGVRVDIVSFDFHAQCKNGRMDSLNSLLWSGVEGHVSQHGYFVKDGTAVKQRQTGILRTNCLDCLDRTNVVQTYFGLKLLEPQLRILFGENAAQFYSRFDEALKVMWVKNGDMLSQLYAGTSALKSDLMRTGKRTTTGIMMDAAKTVSRTIQNNFMDSSQQEAIDVFLGMRIDASVADALQTEGAGLDPMHKRIAEVLAEREAEFTQWSTATVLVGTWNVNGGKRADADSLVPWLAQKTEDGRLPDIFAIGFQEIVDLTAGNIVAADAANRASWEKAIRSALTETGEPYSPVVSEQLVGVCLFVFARSELLHLVRDVVIDKQKTGMKGYAGNKGGVAIRFKLQSSTICFVCAHLAAGQGNITERNENYHQITRQVSFGKGRTIGTHDYVFWLGDFNYRVDLPGDDVRKLCEAKELTAMLNADQLRTQMQAGKVFEGFEEAPIDFLPTYKYDIFTEVYDTSEKERTPAWCDRVLWKGPAAMIKYSRTELMSSDHRPVSAFFQIAVRTCDEERRRAIRLEAMRALGGLDHTVCARPIDPRVTRADIVHLFEGFGPVVALRRVADTTYVSFASADAAQAACSLSGMIIGDKPMQVTVRQPAAAEQATRDEGLSALIMFDDEDESNLYDGDGDENGIPSSASPNTDRPPSIIFDEASGVPAHAHRLSWGGVDLSALEQRPSTSSVTSVGSTTSNSSAPQRPPPPGQSRDSSGSTGSAPPKRPPPPSAASPAASSTGQSSQQAPPSSPRGPSRPPPPSTQLSGGSASSSASGRVSPSPSPRMAESGSVMPPRPRPPSFVPPSAAAQAEAAIKGNAMPIIPQRPGGRGSKTDLLIDLDHFGGTGGAPPAQPAPLPTSVTPAHTTSTTTSTPATAPASVAGPPRPAPIASNAAATPIPVLAPPRPGPSRPAAQVSQATTAPVLGQVPAPYTPRPAAPAVTPAAVAVVPSAFSSGFGVPMTSAPAPAPVGATADFRAMTAPVVPATASLPLAQAPPQPQQQRVVSQSFNPFDDMDDFGKAQIVPPPKPAPASFVSPFDDDFVPRK